MKKTDGFEIYLKSMSKVPLLSKEEEEELLKKVKEGSKEALDKLIVSNLRFVISIANQYAEFGVPFPDLVAAGNLGLVEAAKRFDPSKGVRFTTYAVWWIKQSIISTIWHETDIIRKPNRIQVHGSKINNAYTHLKEVLGREPTIDEIVSYLEEQGVKIDKSAVESTILYKKTFISLETPVESKSEDDNLTIEGLISVHDTEDIEREIAEEDLKRATNEILEILSPRERAIIIYRYGLDGEEPKTLKEVGEILGISRERVRQIERRALKRIKKIALDKGLKDFLENR
ncbi:MAG: RNA polymerase sigma factor RpoD/SigA [Sulfurihydrogenibium sp.]|nr:RNA polymerase sigma factor RpoD/SigA [Sulfurihydrogenibium sp.]